jgi:hypothetical protein
MRKGTSCRTIGSERRAARRRQLVVGGFDAEHTYRADSWICAAAIQHGLFTEHRGGTNRVKEAV